MLKANKKSPLIPFGKEEIWGFEERSNPIFLFYGYIAQAIFCRNEKIKRTDVIMFRSDPLGSLSFYWKSGKDGCSNYKIA